MCLVLKVLQGTCIFGKVIKKAQTGEVKISSRKANENKTLLTLSDTKMKSHNRLPGVPMKVLLENSG